MESLAFIVALIFLSIMLNGLLSLVCLYFKLNILAAIFGVLSIVAGAWLWYTLPHVPWFAVINIGIGLFVLYKIKKGRI